MTHNEMEKSSIVLPSTREFQLIASVHTDADREEIKKPWMQNVHGDIRT